MAQVEQHLVPEPRVQQVQHRVLDAADVQVDAAGVVGAVLAGRGPIQYRSFSGSTERFAVRRVDVAQLVPARTGPVAAWCWCRGGRSSGRRPDPARPRPSRSRGPAAATARSRASVRVERLRRVVVDLGQLDRQHALRAARAPRRPRRRRSGTARPSSAGGRTASRAACTARCRGRAVLLQPGDDRLLGLVDVHAVQEARS